MDKHPHRKLLSRFGRGRRRGENREIVRHLLTGCEECRRVTSELLPRLEYGAAFERSWATVEQREATLRGERTQAAELLDELLAQPAAGAPGSRDARYHTWAFCELLLDAAREWGFQEPARALDLAQLGVEIAGRLDAAIYGDGRIRD